jgi:hypothetical protein
MKLKDIKDLPKSCQKVAEFSDKQQYDEASLWEKLRVQIHIMHCKQCYSYHHKNEALTKLLNTHQFKILSNSEKEDIKAKLPL